MDVKYLLQKILKKGLVYLAIQRQNGIIKNKIQINTRDDKNKFRVNVKWIKFILITILFLITTTLFLMSPVFNIKKIQIVGNEHYNVETILNTTTIKVGNNGFKVLFSGSRNFLTLRNYKEEKYLKRSLPYIESCVIKFNIPGTLVIQIHERTPMGKIPFMGKYLYIDGKGIIIDVIDESSSTELPVIKGVDFDKYELGQALITEKKESINSVVRILDSMEKSDRNTELKIYDLLNTIDVSDINQIILEIDHRLEVNMGELEDLDYRIDFLKQILLKSLRQNEKGLIDFTKGINPSFIPEN